MGLMDKAKRMAEQAQAKLDEVQQDFNASSAPSPPSGGPVTEYDTHGRPIRPEGAAPAPAPPASPTPAAPTAAAPAPPFPPSGEVAADGASEYSPPPLTSGDPLKG